jgi:hypothetical protein
VEYLLLGAVPHLGPVRGDHATWHCHIGQALVVQSKPDRASVAGSDWLKTDARPGEFALEVIEV